jgi:hypothetical protein
MDCKLSFKTYRGKKHLNLIYFLFNKAPPAYEDIEENQENIDPFYPLYTYVLDDEPPSYDTQAIANNYS